MAFYFVTSAHNRYGVAAPKDVTTVTVKGGVGQWDPTAGEVVPSNASSTFTQTEFVFTEDIAAADNLASVHSWKIDSNNQFIADTVNNSSAAHNGQRMILNSAGTKANNTGTDSSVGVFRQIGVVGVASDKQIIGEFVSK